MVMRPHFQYKTDQADKKHKKITQLKRHNNVELVDTCQKLHPDKIHIVLIYPQNSQNIDYFNLQNIGNFHKVEML